MDNFSLLPDFTHPSIEDMDINANQNNVVRRASRTYSPSSTCHESVFYVNRRNIKLFNLFLYVLIILFAYNIPTSEAEARPRAFRVPLKAEESDPVPDDLAGCYFDGRFFDLEETWHPDLGGPIGVMYCVRCDCLALPQKGKFVGKVRCKNFKHECPKTNCKDAIRLPNQCCKTCPNQANTTFTGISHQEQEDEFQHPDSDMTSEVEFAKEFTSLMSGADSPYVARGIIYYSRPSLHYTIYFSNGIPVKSILFLDANDNLILEQSVTRVNFVESDQYCGVWDRLPRAHRKMLISESMKIAISTELHPNGLLLGFIRLKREFKDEQYTAILAPVSLNSHAGVVAGSAMMETAAHHSAVRFHIQVQLHARQYRPGLRRGQQYPAKLTLFRPDEGITIKEITAIAFAHTDSSFGIKTRINDLTSQESKWLARGKLHVNISSGALRYAPSITGTIVARPTCNWFQAILYETERTLRMSEPGERGGAAAGVALVRLRKDGSISYSVKLDGLRDEEPVTQLTIESEPKRKSRRRRVDDITMLFRNGSVNGTYSKQNSRDLKMLLADKLYINGASDSNSNLVQGGLHQILFENVHLKTFPSILSEKAYPIPRLDNPGAGAAWMRFDEHCVLHYDIYLDGYTKLMASQMRPFLQASYLRPTGKLERKSLPLNSFRGLKSSGKLKNLKKDALRGLGNGSIEVQIIFPNESEARLKGKVSIIDNCSPKHVWYQGWAGEDANVNKRLEEGDYSCRYEDELYPEGESWNAKHQECAMCHCKRGRVTCDTVQCPEPACAAPVKIIGECCLVCPSSRLNASMSNEIPTLTDKPSGCKFHNKIRKPGSSWHPYIPPFGYSKCVRCTCEIQSLTVNCTRQTCEKLECNEEDAFRINPLDCCKTCPEHKPKVMEVTPPPNSVSVQATNNVQSDARPSIVLHTPNEVLRHGGCKFQNRYYTNGEEWHPRVMPFGTMNCILCRCKDGNSKCRRQKCPLLKCPFVVRPGNNCCPECATRSNPEARPNRRWRRYKMKLKAQNRMQYKVKN